ncbi:MAG: hypothetical protein J07HQW2_00430 [Haloquadratum walsbyi J07HQW2]|uniref:Uncharacterized protein n=1 Tax=Haloquadratum walsbyi J07HQW2 TaxID=1238425 RepID=U1PNY8_9EURY|nr:MAG: hypothetical protein J07HQW2_00430 [Haloquadratum walsbyi J07HQW2]
MSFKPARTRQRIPVTNSPFALATSRALLTRPRLGFFLEHDTVFFAHVLEAVDEPAVRPEVVRFLGHTRRPRPVRAENTLGVANVQR